MQERTKAQRKKQTITLSLDQEIIDRMELEASQKGISINANVNTVLLKYTHFYKEIEERETQLMPKKAFQFYIDQVDISEHIEFLEPLLFEQIQITFHENKLSLNLKNVLEVFFENIAINSGAIDTIKYYINYDGFFIIAIKHSYNIKWSEVSAVTFKNLFLKLFHYNVEYEAHPNSFILKILEKNISV